MGKAKAHDAARISDAIQHELDSVRRGMRNEALGSIAVGAGIIIAAYWIVFVFLIEGMTNVLGRLGYTLPFSSVIGTPLSYNRLAIGSVWFIVAAAMAWMQVSPFARPEPLAGKKYDPYFDPPPTRVVREEGLGCVAQVFGGGPRNIFEGIATLRDMPRTNSSTLASAAEYLALAASPDGITAKSLARDDLSANAMALLWRLKLVMKPPTFSSSWAIVATPRGRGIVDA